MSKKARSQTINNIQELNLEIDYNKLAESIVEAQKKSDNNANREKRFTSGTFVSIITLAFYSLSMIGGLVTVLIPIAIYNAWELLKWNTLTGCVVSVVSILLMIGIMTILALYSVILWRSAKEIEKEKDRNYIVSVFSGIVSFAALIVALVALVKG